MREGPREQAPHTGFVAPPAPGGLRRRFASNAGAMLGASFFSKLANFVYVPLVVRLLSPEDYARAIVAATLVGFFTPLADAGLTSVLGREVARRQGRAGGLYQAVQRLMVLSSTLAIAGCLLAAWGLAYGPQSQRLVWLMALSLASYPVLNTLTGALSGRQQMVPLAMVGSVVICLKAALAWPLLWRWPSPFVFLGLETCMAFLQSAWLWGMARRMGLLRERAEAHVPVPPTRWWLGEGFPFLAAGLSFLVLNRVDLLLLDKLSSPLQVALYGAAYRLFEMLFMLPRPIAQALFPALSTVTQEKDRFHRAVQKSFVLHAHLGLWLAGGLFFAAPLLPWLLGREYDGAVWVLRLLLLGLPVVYWCWPPSTALGAVGRQRAVMWVSLLGTVASIGLNLWAIPRYGAAGAAVVNGVAFAVSALGFVVVMAGAFPRQVFLDPKALPSFAAPVLAGVAGALAMRFSPVVSGGLFGVVYLAVAWWLFPFEEQERQRVLQFLRRRKT